MARPLIIKLIRVRKAKVLNSAGNVELIDRIELNCKLIVVINYRNLDVKMLEGVLLYCRSVFKTK